MRQKHMFLDSDIIPKRYYYDCLSICTPNSSNIAALLKHFFPERALSDNFVGFCNVIKENNIALNYLGLLCYDYQEAVDLLDKRYKRHLSADEVLQTIFAIDFKVSEEISLNEWEQSIRGDLEFKLAEKKYKKLDEFDYVYVLISSKEYYDCDKYVCTYFSFELVHNREVALDHIYSNRKNKCYCDDGTMIDLYTNALSLTEIKALKDQFSNDAFSHLERLMTGEFHKCYQAPQTSYSEHFDGSPLWFLSSLDWRIIQKDTYKDTKLL